MNSIKLYRKLRPNGNEPDKNDINIGSRSDVDIEDLFNDLVKHSKILQHESFEYRRLKFYQYHLPMYSYVQTLYSKHLSIDHSSMISSLLTVTPSSLSIRRPLLIGLSAPQGCGKTTLTTILSEMFRLQGINCITMSIDDFYLTGKQQDALAIKNKHNKLLEFRGNAGTHDLDLIMKTLRSLLNLNTHDSPIELRNNNTYNTTSSNKVCKIPYYDKSMRQGRGDRVPVDQWQEVSAPVDIVILEGWMLGFTPLAEEVIPHPVAPLLATVADDILTNINSNDQILTMCKANVTNKHTQNIILQSKSSNSSTTATKDSQDDTHNNSVEEEVPSKLKAHSIYKDSDSLMQINNYLHSYRAIHELMDEWIVLAVQSPDVVYKWRLEAEQLMIQNGKSGMSDSELQAFVSRFMPAYELYLPNLYTKGPQRRQYSPDHGSSNNMIPSILKLNIGVDRLPTNIELL